MIHHVTRATKHLIFWSLIVAAIALSGIRLALKGVEKYKADLEGRIGALLDATVKVGGLSANMRGVSPELVIKDIQLEPNSAGKNHPLNLQEIRLGIDLGKFLLRRDSLSSSSVTVVGAKLKINREPDGSIAVEGLKAGKGQPLWLLKGNKYELLQSQITWQDKQQQAKPIVLDNVNVAVMNNGAHHRINAIAKLSANLGEGLTAIADFDGNADHAGDIKGSVFVRGDKIKLHELLSPYLPLELGITKGIGDFSIWGQWQHGNLVAIETAARLQDAVLIKKSKDNLQIHSLDTLIKWQGTANEWQVDIGRFLLESPENGKTAPKKWQDAIFSVAGENSADSSVKKLKLYAKQLELAEAASLAQFFAPTGGNGQEQLKMLTQTKPIGVIKDFSLYVQPDNNDFGVAGWFNGVGFEPFAKTPGVANISGQIKGCNDFGKIELSSKDSFLEAPSLFAKPLKFNTITGVVSWRQKEDQWHISSPSITIDSPAFDSESRFAVEIPKAENKPKLDIQITFKSDDIKQAAAYMPVQIMKNKLKNWLTNAFVGGKISRGDFLVYGKAGDFPYTDGNGVFEGQLEVVGGELNYHPEWPRISGINGTVSFAKDAITGNFNHGIIEKAVINKAEMLIFGLAGEPYLSIKGEGQGEANQGLAILNNSPFAGRVTPLMTSLKVQGNVKASLNLGIPLVPDVEDKIEGNVELADNQMTVNQLGLKIDNIKGDLKFNNTGIYGEKIQGLALGHPIQATITQEAQQTLVDVTGKSSVKAVEKLFNLPESKVAEGESDYLLELKIPKIVDSSNPFDISVKSTLEGVALNVPGLLAKTKQEQKPTVFSVKLTDPQSLPLDLDFNSEFKAAISLNAKERKINSGHIVFGKGDAKQRKTPGIKLEIGQEHLALQDWIKIAANQTPGTTTAWEINEIHIHSLSAYWQKTRLGAFYMLFKRNENNWDGEIDSAFGRGKFQLPLDMTATNPVLLDMDMINLTAIKQLKLQEGTEITHNGFKPLITIKSKKTLWQSENLGKLSIQTEREPNGIKIKKLELIGEDEKLFMMGNWKENGIQSTTQVTGKLEMRKADELFDRLNITKDLTGTNGVINFKLRWNAPPWHVSFPTLHGTVDAKLKEGRILSIEPGFGRVLGILAVAQWIKRLQLDFSDIYEEGLTFNSIKGHFDVLNGNAESKGLVIDAVPATITIAGDTNLVNQTVDHVIKVVPKSLDAVPIAGTIVSKVASVLGKTLTGKDQDGFLFGSEYLVKGNWNDIKVSSSHENDGLVKKTWRSITEFPWE